jgi:hypothetical protein
MTSIGNLLTALQIEPGSFNASYRDKQLLYSECLRVFTIRILSELKPLVQPRNCMRVTNYFLSKPFFGGGSEWLRFYGCMMVNTLLNSVAE